MKPIITLNDLYVKLMDKENIDIEGMVYEAVANVLDMNYDLESIDVFERLPAKIQDLIIWNLDAKESFEFWMSALGNSKYGQ